MTVIMTDCIFCKIIRKEIPAEIIYENDSALALLDINPKAPGHTMVLAKVHAPTILDLPEKEVEPVFGAVKKVTAMIKEVLRPDGFTIGINHGRYAGQAIDHLHIHILPRYKGDGGTSIHGVVNNPPQESLNEMRQKILKSYDH